MIATQCLDHNNPMMFDRQGLLSRSCNGDLIQWRFGAAQKRLPALSKAFSALPKKKPLELVSKMGCASQCIAFFVGKNDHQLR
jgi:hypothetical protein